MDSANEQSLMRIVGLDLSLTETGMCHWQSGHTPEVCSIRPSNGCRDFSRLKEIMERVLDGCAGADVVVIEGLSMGKAMGKAFERAGLHYMIRYTLWVRKVRTVIVPPSSVKKFATGKGNSEKNLMLREVYRRFQVEASNDNEADAAALAFVGAAIAGQWQPTCDAQREVLKKLESAEHAD
jgi:crossover junction endodeoxyribonuclease RuvC